MTNAALVSALVVVGAVATCDLLLSLALARRVRLIQDRGWGQAKHDDMPAVGEVIAPFETTAVDGTTVSNREFAEGSSLVAFLAVGCDPCLRVKTEILASPPQEPVTVFVSGPASADTPGLVAELAQVARVVWSEIDESVRDAFHVRAYPTVVRVVNGVVVAAGLAFGEVNAPTAARP